MTTYFAYIRVSTFKQGEQGVSLQEQREAINRHAQRNGLRIAAWFEEKQTAAKRGRPVFSRMLGLLKKGKAKGVIIHKIDRSARNLKDWADLGELIDRGVEVHFANEALDLHSRGGRLSADIQAVVAADYIRNLREETRKGIYGRLKQGLFPFPAPVGYRDRGPGQPKALDPVKAPLVRKAFELYASGRYNLDSLAEQLHLLGLRNRNGGRVSRNGLSVLLGNPFYVGLIRLQQTGETFSAAHDPLIGRALFERVQRVLSGKTNRRSNRHELLFRRLLRCGLCRYSLIGECQKGHVYYRCHTKGCPTTGVRQDKVESRILERLKPLRFSPDEQGYLREKLQELRLGWATERESYVKSLTLRVTQIRDRLNRLTDAYLDGAIDKELFEQRKEALLLEKKGAEENIRDSGLEGRSIPERLAHFLELAGSAYSSYKQAILDEKRALLQVLTSNRLLDGENLIVELKKPFETVANRFQNTNGGPYRDVPRTVDELIQRISQILERQPDLAAEDPTETA